MTISSTIRKAGPFIGNGSTSVFPFAFKVFLASDVLVIQTVDGVEATKVLNTDYSVGLNADQSVTPGGVIYMAVAPAVGATLTLTSQVPETQGVDLKNAGGFYPEVLNNALDRAVILIQQLREQVGRALRAPVSTPDGITLEIPAPEANKLLGWNADANALVNVEQASGGGGSGPIFPTAVANKLIGWNALGTALVNTDPISPGPTFPTAVGDKLIGWNPAGTALVNKDPAAGGVVPADLASITDAAKGSALTGYFRSFTGWVGRTVSSKLNENPTVLDFGAVGDGIVNDTLAFQNAAAAFPNSKIGVPGSRTYKLTANVSAYWEIEAGCTFNSLTPQIKQRGFFTTGVGGANIHRVFDRLFVGKANDCDGKQSGGVTGWISTMSAGIYAYLATTATVFVTCDSPGGGVAISGIARDNGTGLSPGVANIGVSGFAYQDTVGSTGNVWALYGTALRVAGGGSSSFGMELDIANLGTTVPLFPNNMFPTGLTSAAWLCSGGETTAAGLGAICKTASVALGIISNDPAFVANFDKGIVFHNRSINGCDGSTGTGVAIAFAKGHAMTWYNNSSELTSAITSSVSTAAGGHTIEFSDTGLRVAEASGAQGTLFKVPVVSNASNYLQVLAGTTGNSPVLQAAGADANLDVLIATKGTGVLRVNYGSFAAANPANFSAQRCLPIKDGNDIVWYTAVSTIPW